MKTKPNDLVNSFNHTPDTEGNFNGLTKREYFASQAIIAGYSTVKCVEMSDSLIRELNKITQSDSEVIVLVAALRRIIREIELCYDATPALNTYIIEAQNLLQKYTED